MVLKGMQPMLGEWRFSALPWFDPATGQFRGYRGSARRPHRNEQPYRRPDDADSGDSIRQLIHELRSPLNAISGFAQIVAGQMFGPVSQSYRRMAETIVADAQSVQTIIDDLETAARGNREGHSDQDVANVVDLAHIVAQVESDLAELLRDQSVDISISRIGGPFAGLANDADARRMVGRLLTALIDVSEPGSIPSVSSSPKFRTTICCNCGSSVRRQSASQPLPTCSIRASVPRGGTERDRSQPGLFAAAGRQPRPGGRGVSTSGITP